MATRVGLILCLVACALGAAASRASADVTPSPTVIADGVQIGSVVVGGLTSDQATAAIQDTYFASVVVHVGHRNYPVSPHHFHTALSLAPAIQTALTAPADTAIPLTPTLDTQLIVKWVKALAGKTDRAAVAGSLLLRNNRPFFTHGHSGRSLRPFPTRMMIRSAILSGTRTVIVAPLKKLSLIHI